MSGLNKKYRISFSSTVKPCVSKEKDKYLSLASLQTLKGFIPNVDVENNIDLLPVSFNICVVNRVNKNDDVIDTKTALATYKQFINKPINIEHDRGSVVGVILTSSLSKFGSDEKLEEKDVENSLVPFNITLGGVVWRVVDKNLSSLLENAADPSSPYYNLVSASWEVAYDEHEIALIKGESKNLEDAEIVTDKDKIEKLTPSLRALKGSGTIGETHVYRKPIDIIFIGGGFTTSPAAEVKGVAVEDTAVALELEEDSEASLKKEEKSQEKISHLDKLDVKENRIAMKIKSRKDINDESLKTATASEITEVLDSELKEAADKYITSVSEKDKLIKANEEKVKDLEKGTSALTTKVAELEGIVASLKTEKETREKEETFNQRMSKWDAEYDLTNEDRQILASSIKGLEKEAYATYEKNMSVLLKEKNTEVRKAGLAAAEAAKKEQEPKKEVVAATVVEDVIKKGLETVKTEVPATVDTKPQSVKEKYAKAFAVDQFEITIRK